MSGQATVTEPQGKPLKRKKARFTVWDRIMALSDVGIATWAVITYIFLYLPVVVLILYSFTSDQFNLKWTHPTLEWYRSQPQASSKVIGVIHDPTIIKAFETSIEIAVISTIIAVIIGTLGSFALERFEFRTKNLWDGLNYTKIIIAEVVAGVSSLLFFVQLDKFLYDYLYFNFGGLFKPGFADVLIAHVAWNIPFVVVIIRARLKGFDRAIEEAGADLGARPTTVFFRITLPVIFPGILAAALLSFTLSFDDFVTTFFTAGPTTVTLPLKIWSMVKMGITPEINAISTFMMALSMTIVVVLELKARISEQIA
jgi:spermidine/putrescine transport system permease protein